MLNTIIVVAVCVGSVIIVAVVGYIVAHAHDREQRRNAETLADTPPDAEQPDTDER